MKEVEHMVGASCVSGQRDGNAVREQGVMGKIGQVDRNGIMQGLAGPGQEARLRSEHEEKPFQDAEPAFQGRMCPKSTWSSKAGARAVVRTLQPTPSPVCSTQIFRTPC